MTPSSSAAYGVSSRIASSSRARVRALGVARLREHRVGERARRRRGLRRGLAEHARRLHEPVERHPALQERGQRPRAEHVQLAERGHVGRRQRQPGRAPDRLQRRQVHADLGSATSRAVRPPAPPDAPARRAAARAAPPPRPPAARPAARRPRAATRAAPRATSARAPRGRRAAPARRSPAVSLTRRRAPATGTTATGIPLSTALPESASTCALVGEQVRVDAGVRAGDAQPRAAARRGPSRAGARRRPAMTASVTSTGASSAPARLSTRAGAPSARPSRAASSGCTWSVQRSGPETSSSRLCIHELFERSWRRPTSTSPSASRAPRQRGAQPRDVGDDRGGRELDPAARRAQHLGQPRLQRAEVDAVRRGLEVGERQVVRDRRAAAGRAAARARAAAPARRAARVDVAPVQRRVRRGRLAPHQLAGHEPVERLDVVGRRLPRRRGRQPQQRDPLVRHAGVRREHGRRVVGHVADRPAGRARGRSASAAAATARAGPRRRGASSR